MITLDRRSLSVNRPGGFPAKREAGSWAASGTTAHTVSGGSNHRTGRSPPGATARGIPVMAQCRADAAICQCVWRPQDPGQGRRRRQDCRSAIAVAKRVVLEKLTEPLARRTTGGGYNSRLGRLRRANPGAGRHSGYAHRFPADAELGSGAEAAIAEPGWCSGRALCRGRASLWDAPRAAEVEQACPIVRTFAELRTVATGWRRLSASVVVVPTRGPCMRGVRASCVPRSRHATG